MHFAHEGKFEASENGRSAGGVQGSKSPLLKKLNGGGPSTGVAITIRHNCPDCTNL